MGKDIIQSENENKSYITSFFYLSLKANLQLFIVHYKEWQLME